MGRIGSNTKKSGRRTYVTALIIYLMTCVLILAIGFFDVRDTVETYNKNQARLVSTLLVENVNEALEHIVAQVEQVSRAIAGGHESDSGVIYEELLAYAARSDVCSIGYVDVQMNMFFKGDDANGADDGDGPVPLKDFGGQCDHGLCADLQERGADRDGVCESAASDASGICRHRKS